MRRERGALRGLLVGRIDRLRRGDLAFSDHVALLAAAAARRTQPLRGELGDRRPGERRKDLVTRVIGDGYRSPLAGFRHRGCEGTYMRRLIAVTVAIRSERLYYGRSGQGCCVAPSRGAGTRMGMTPIPYSSPRIDDYGSLRDLTADFDITFVGSVAKAVTIAGVSAIVAAPGPDAGTGVGGPGPDAGTGVGGPGPEAGIKGVSEAGGADTSTPNAGPSGGGAPSGGTVGASNGSPTGGAQPSGGSGGPGDVSGSGGAGGTLPFTGYAVMVTAAVGAALTGAGLRIRSALRHRV